MQKNDTRKRQIIGEFPDLLYFERENITTFSLTKILIFCLISTLCLIGCTEQSESPSLFTLLDAEKTGVTFSNDLQYSDDFNPYIFKNFFNGGGVAIGDINNDGLADLFFCGNMVDNQLYLNRGNFQFEDITKGAGVASKNVWSSGVSFADVNGDGWLDIYVCKSGKPGGELRHNELFINNGVVDENGMVGFKEMAAAYGIADKGLSAHAAFFDYDKDGDLDMYLLNNSLRPVGGFDIRPGLREIRDADGGNKLYRNELISNGEATDNKQITFTDVSEEVGIYGSNIGYGLGVTIGDVNKDGWQDIYISNDFFERDYLYINKGDGTFQEDLENQIREISAGSMGADMADLNNDAYPEIFVTDMLPETEDRYKAKMTFENWDKYQLNVQNGYYHQFTRNVLQLNNKNGSFSEIGRLAGVHATDWSWSALLADLNNDGFKDIYVTNGIYQDLMDQDYINFYAHDPTIIGAIKNREKGAILKLIDKMPSEPIPNYAFENNGDLTFNNTTIDWGLATPSFSNGAAYGDLDNDGDLDLVVNNCNMPAFIYRNEADTLLNNHFLSFDLEGVAPNTNALGTQITIFNESSVFYQELVTSKGFQSSINPSLLFGLGDLETVDRVEVKWPDNTLSILEKVPTNQHLKLKQADAKPNAAAMNQTKASENSIFEKITLNKPFSITHKENRFSDFDRDRLLFQMVSAEGPKMAKGDINGDGLEDVFLGASAGYPSQLLIQQADGTFSPSNEAIFEQTKRGEDTDVLFFDADADGDLDIYVAKGSNEFTGLAPELIDLLYINDGQGNLSKSPQRLPVSDKTVSSSCVRAADFDGDGDKDLFVGIRLKSGVYGIAVTSYLLENNGKGQFKNINKEKAPALEQVGMVTDARWFDIDGDADLDLILVGDWMPIKVFENDKGNLVYKENWAPKNTAGFWNCLEIADLDADGDMDLVLGNHGNNTRFKASSASPLELYVNDFDKNRTAEQIIAVPNNGTAYPLALRHDLVMQLPNLKKKYLLYENYKGQKVSDIFDDKQVRTAAKSKVEMTASSIALNDGKGNFSIKALPQAAQFAPVYAILLRDFDKDGHLDILLGGNFYRSKPEVGIYDGSYGLVLKGDGKGSYNALTALQSGIFIKGEIRDFLELKVDNQSMIVVGRNNDTFQFFKNP